MRSRSFTGTAVIAANQIDAPLLPVCARIHKNAPLLAAERYNGCFREQASHC